MNVSLEHIAKSFGNRRVVDDISLEIEDGELFFLLGPSGCGKTTLLRCVAGFYVPEAGTIRIGTRDVTRLPPHARDAAMVFQSYALWPHLTVAENVAFGLELRHLAADECRRRVGEALELVQMADRAGDKPNQLSGGQQQRIALARALVVRPRCLLLDEPLSNLDAKLRLEMRGEIRRICKESGLTAIYVTHDQKEALSIADRLAVLNEGKIQQCGKPRDVYVHPASRFVAQFIGDTNFLEGQVRQCRPGRIEVATAAGTIVSAVDPTEPVAAGRAVTLSLRPEIVRLGDPPAGAPNVMEGVIHDTVYLGEIAQHAVNLGADGGPVLKAFEINPRYLARDRESVRVRVWFAPEDVVVLFR